MKAEPAARRFSRSFLSVRAATAASRCSKRFALTTALLAFGATAGTASAATSTLSNPAPIAIPDAVGPVNSPAVPYPSTINVSGFAGNVGKVTATLHGFTHVCPDDIAVLLVGPTGANSILMGHVGGCVDPARGPVVDLTFDQASVNALGDGLAEDYPSSGTYRPSQSPTDPPETLSSPAPPGPYPVDLNIFNGHPANGIWQLFVEDQSQGSPAEVDDAVQGGWSLALTAPVNTVTTGRPKLNKKNGTARLPVTVRDSGELSLTGKGVKAASASKAKAVGGPGTVKLPVRPKGKTKNKLSSTGKASVKVKVTFTPTGGASSAQTKKIKLKKTLG